MTNTQKENILWAFNFACEKFWKYQAEGNREMRDYNNQEMIGMTKVIQYMGYEIVWNDERKFAIDIVEAK